MNDCFSRPVVRVTGNDLVAAMQILACIARPTRPADAGDLMQQWFWARKRSRREDRPEIFDIKIPDKDRISAKLPALAKDLANAFEAGRWLKSKLMAESDCVIVKAFGSSIRQEAANRWNKERNAAILRDTARVTSRDDETAIAKQRIWIKRRPVAHMAMAVREQIREEFPDGFNGLEELVFHPIWVPEALERAEDYHNSALQHKIVKNGESWLFQR